MGPECIPEEHEGCVRIWENECERLRAAMRRLADEATSMTRSSVEHGWPVAVTSDIVATWTQSESGRPGVTG